MDHLDCFHNCFSLFSISLHFFVLLSTIAFLSFPSLCIFLFYFPQLLFSLFHLFAFFCFTFHSCFSLFHLFHSFVLLSTVAFLSFPSLSFFCFTSHSCFSPFSVSFHSFVLLPTISFLPFPSLCIFLFHLEGVLQVCLPTLMSHFSFIFLTFKISFFPFQTLHLLKMKVCSYRFGVFSNENADDCF